MTENSAGNMLITEGTEEIIYSWRHTGFSVYSGKRISSEDSRSKENLARYIISKTVRPVLLNHIYRKIGNYS